MFLFSGQHLGDHRFNIEQYKDEIKGKAPSYLSYFLSLFRGRFFDSVEPLLKLI